MEIGIDIEQNERFKNKDIMFLEKIFSHEEISYAKKQKYFEQNLCAFWCVKEAFIKAIGEKNVPLNKICILHNELGKPYIQLNKEIKAELEKHNLTEIKISLSHTKDFSTAVCLIK